MVDAVNSSQNIGSQIGFGGVSVAGIVDEDSNYPFNLNSAIAFTDIGKAVCVDASGDTQVRLVGTGDIVLGRLETMEARTTEGISVGTVLTEGGMVLPLDPTGGATFPAPGDSVQGGVALGTVVKLAAAQGRTNVVTSVDASNLMCTVLFL